MLTKGKESKKRKLETEVPLKVENTVDNFDSRNIHEQLLQMQHLLCQRIDYLEQKIQRIEQDNVLILKRVLIMQNNLLLKAEDTVKDHRKIVEELTKDLGVRDISIKHESFAETKFIPHSM